MDILQPSPTKVGGLSEARKIAILAAAWNVPVVPHWFLFRSGSGRGAASGRVHPGIAWVEWPMGELVTPLLEVPIRPEAGALAPPAGPGLGGRPNEAALRGHPLGAASSPAFSTG